MINLPPGIDIDKLISDLRMFSWEASDILVRYSQMLRDPNNKIKIIEDKNNNDAVTKADLEVNELIIKKICKNYKNINWEILSEENSKLDSRSCNLNSDWIWILDPLDGTRDFIQGTNNYAMHLALNYKNKPYLGVVLIPEKDELWIANGSEVWCENRNRFTRRTNFSDKKSLEEMTIVTSKNHRNNVLNNLIDSIPFKKVNVMGSVGCKIASILRGESDIYISLSLPGQSAPKDWDFASPEVILKTAGGAITNLFNEDLTYNQKNLEQGGIIIASNNFQNHENICLQVREIIKRYNICPI